ncbi:hypothetical protein [Sulfurimicrobium lacus]|uniref:hypothetical protein n=1 Tax=Sulfurimicrobium lacus TaxID=2715678 RepID=UPI0015666D93|nr:hypothetical protein [Sulfurimicrobium lacus]
MKSPKKMPQFSYNLSIPHRDDFRCIMANDAVFHRIRNNEDFYKALGYTDEMTAIGMLPDEFIWDKYTSDKASKTTRCLQPKISEYLFNHSEDFRKEYVGEYTKLIGNCDSDRRDDSELCVNCPMHPRFLY